MRRVVLACWVLVALASNSSAVTLDEDGTRLHAETISSFFPRLEGSPGEAELIDYLEIVLARSGVTTVIRSFADADGGHSFSRVIEAVIPGDGPGTLILAVPLDHGPQTSRDNDGTASVAAALSLAEAAASQPHARTLRIVFVGADFGSEDNPALGSRRYLSDYFPDGAHALLYLNASSPGTRMTTGASGIVSPWWLVRRTIDAATATRVDVQVEGSLNQVHRLGISTTPPALETFLNAGIPAVYLESSARGFASPDTTESAVALGGFLESWIAAFEDGIPEQWDRHYLQFQFGDELVVIGEPFFVGVLAGVLLFTLLYALVFRRRFRRYLRTILKNVWNIPLLFLLIFAFLSAGTYAINAFLLLRGFPQMWLYYPVAYVSLKGLIALFLFTVASQLLRRLPLSKNGSFYSAAALFVLFFDIVLFSIINISFGHYFIWAYIAAFIFSVVPNRFLKVVSMLFAPLLLFQAVVAVIRIPESGLTSLLLSPVGDLMLSFVALPFLLMLMRLDFLIRHPVKGKRSFTLRTASLVSGLAILGLLSFVAVSNPFSASNPQPVRAVETIDYPALERRLVVSSPAPLGSLDVSFAGGQVSMETNENRWQVESAVLPDVLSVRLTYEQFIDRERGALVIDAPQPLRSVSVRLFSEQPLVLYDASFPFTIAADQQSAEIHIGERPPLPLLIDYTVGGTLLPGVEVRASSNSHPDPLRVEGRPLELSTQLEVITRFEQ